MFEKELIYIWFPGRRASASSRRNGGSLDNMDGEAVTFGSGLRGIVSDGGRKGAVIITHGAGKGMDSSILKKTAEKLAAMGFIVLRFNFGYLDRKSAPSLGGKKEQPDLVSAIDFMQEHGPPILIGKSFGARVCANVALERTDVKALVFYGLPLQGASPTSKPRDWSHLSKLQAPILFITGDKDQLCPLEKLGTILDTIKAPYRSEIVPGDHSFKPRSEDLAIEKCIAWVDELAQD